jgi:serine/threonine protein kinase
MSMIGKSLVHYEISAEIGRGGMGEVYQAKDTKLGRDVAIKVLPEEFALDKDRVTRFQREAKLLASLNHPNIAAIYGLEESDGTHFLVMELIEGETLKDRIKSGPIPVEEALKLALQMAEALEAAHENGVIHRDLKPANIKITPDGKVKILDFGLAKAYVGDQENLSPMDSPTISAAATQQGVILGTAAYMSPEQAKGKSVDKRADIWAFGVVLFEMLTGRQSFTGETASETLASVMKSEPEWDSLQPNLHSRIRLLLERCLEKDPKNRYSGISDARVDIQKALADPSGIFAQPISTAEPRRNLRSTVTLIAAAVILTAIIVGVVVLNLKKPESSEITRFYYELPEGQQFSSPIGKVLAVSPDGKQFVYSTSQGLHLRSIGELDAKLIAGTSNENPTFPFFSPDGKWLGYSSAGKLKKIAMGGGAPVTLCDVNGVFGGGSWGDDNTIVYAELPNGIMRISANGGTPESLFKPEEGSNYALPQILPDGESVLFQKSIPDPLTIQIVVQSLESESPKDLFVGSNARYLPTGHIVYTVGDNILDIGGHNLFAVPFDLDRLEVTGGQVPLVEDIRGPFGMHYAISDSGTLVYMPGATGELVTGRTLVWVDKEGKEEPITAPPNIYVYPKISPDGTRAALGISPDSITADIWIWNFLRKTLTRLTFEGAGIPIWSPDSKRIIYSATRDDQQGVYWRNADGTGKEEMLYSEPDRTIFPLSITGDGGHLVVSVIEGSATLQNSKWDIGILSMEGEHVLKPLLHDDYVEVQAQISPDSRWIAYASDEATGEALKTEIYVRPFPEVDQGKWQVSTNGGSSPRWSPDGQELIYLGDDNTVMSVAIETDPALNLGTPRKFFQSNYVGLGTEGTPYDIHPESGRLLMMKTPLATIQGGVGESPRRINVVLNWFEELKQRVPVD